MTKRPESFEGKALREVRAYRNLLQEPMPPTRRRRSRHHGRRVPILVALVLLGLSGGVLVERTADRILTTAPQVASLPASAPEALPRGAVLPRADASRAMAWRVQPTADFDIEGGLARTHGLIAPVPRSIPMSPAAPISPAAPVPEVPVTAAEPPQWQRNAVARAPGGARPMIAIVLDDLGLNRPGARRAIALPAPMTLAFMTYAERLPAITGKARAAGHELLVHVPMEPESRTEDPGLNALLTELDPATLQHRLRWGLDRFEGYVGINNHMGSRFTSQTDGMRAVFAELGARGLMFLDSKTTAHSVARELAAEYRVAYIARDVFLDNAYKSRESIRRQLAKLERIAERNGSAIGLGHPHRTTLEELARWIPEMRARGFALVPVSAIAEQRTAEPSS